MDEARRAGARAGWILVAAVAAAGATSFAGGFVHDDWRVVVQDPRVQSLAAWWSAMPGIRPLLKLSYALNHASGLGLAGFHAVNLLSHAAAALLVHALLLRLERRLDPAAPAHGAALIGALLFALHPVQTEAVTYVSGRPAALAGALALGSAVAWLDGRERGGWRLPLLSVALFAAALGVKEYVAVLPAALLLLEAGEVRRSFSWRAALGAVAPHGVVLAGAAGLVLASPTYRWLAGTGLSLRPPGDNLPTQAVAVAWLSGQLLRPWSLSAEPGLPALASVTPAAAASGLALVSAAVAGVAWLRSRPAVGLAILWFLLWLAPTGWVVPRRDPASERQLYLALVGPAWLAARALAAWAGAGAARRAAVVALLVALGGGFAARSLVYRDELSFWADAAAKSPWSARAWNNLGVALAEACRSREAERAFERALQADPGHFRAEINLGLLRQGGVGGPDDAGRCHFPPPRPSQGREPPRPTQSHAPPSQGRATREPPRRTGVPPREDPGAQLPVSPSGSGIPSTRTGSLCSPCRAFPEKSMKWPLRRALVSR